MPTSYEHVKSVDADVAGMSHLTKACNDPSAVEVDPVIAALENAGAPTVPIDGFLGTSSNESIRIYRTLDTSRYLEIPKEAIVHVQSRGNGERGALRAFVRASSEILSVERTRVRALDLAGGSVTPAPQAGPILQVGGDWEIIQDNGFRVNIRVVQNRERFHAFASHSNGSVKSVSVEGFVTGSQLEMIVTWNNSTKGLYTGALTQGFFTAPFTGYLKGNTRDVLNPGSRAEWYTERIFEIA